MGAKTGRDGIHGATMASAEFGEGSEEKRPAVQVGDPFIISSGYRCDKHPIEAAKPTPGEHNEGTCADIYVSYEVAFKVNAAASNHPLITGIGVNQKGDARFLHLGTSAAKDGRPRPHIWSY